jgi:hypothetical protein
MAEYEKRGYLLENFRLFHLRSQKGENVDYHYHEFCKLLLLVSGRGSYVVDGQRYILQPGDGHRIRRQRTHRRVMLIIPTAVEAAVAAQQRVGFFLANRADHAHASDHSYR